jgi:hypothetical protein
MLADGDDAGRCSNGLTAQRLREAATEERAVFRKWLRGLLVLHGARLMTSFVAVATCSGAHMQLTDLLVRPSASLPAN